MIRIDLGRIPPHSTTGPHDTATATVDGHIYAARSRASAVCAVARLLVAGGVPDGPWEAYSATGTRSLVGRSIHRMAGLTIVERSDGGLAWRKWQPYDGPAADDSGTRSTVH